MTNQSALVKKSGHIEDGGFEKRGERPSTTPVQLRLNRSDFEKLQQLADELGCHRTSVLRFLLRKCSGIHLDISEAA